MPWREQKVNGFEAYSGNRIGLNEVNDGKKLDTLQGDSTNFGGHTVGVPRTE